MYTNPTSYLLRLVCLKQGACSLAMGRGMGAANFPYPKWVWSPAGGWWCEPKQWKRNTAICLGVWGVALFFTFKFSARNERRLGAPADYPIPSQYWCKHAAEDDPRLKDIGWDE